MAANKLPFRCRSHRRSDSVGHYFKYIAPVCILHLPTLFDMLISMVQVIRTFCHRPGLQYDPIPVGAYFAFAGCYCPRNVRGSTVPSCVLHHRDHGRTAWQPNCDIAGPLRVGETTSASLAGTFFCSVMMGSDAGFRFRRLLVSQPWTVYIHGPGLYTASSNLFASWKQLNSIYLLRQSKLYERLVMLKVSIKLSYLVCSLGESCY